MEIKNTQPIFYNNHTEMAFFRKHANTFRGLRRVNHTFWARGVLVQCEGEDNEINTITVYLESASGYMSPISRKHYKVHCDPVSRKDIIKFVEEE
jgi:hypothetical protein